MLVLEQIAAEQANLQNRFYQAETSSQHYADFVFGSVQTLTGIFSTIGLYAEIPDYATPTEAILRISYTASDLILTNYSSLTFYMNGSPFHSDHIAINAGGGETVLYIPIPVGMLQQGYNYLQIKSYVRLTDDEGCTDDFNDANWLRIAETTCLRIGYEVKQDAESLEYFPYPLISMMDTSGMGGAIAVSNAADNSELEAALTVMAGLGSAVSGRNDLELCRLSETARQHVLYFGLKQNTDARLLELLTREVPPTGALLQRAQMDGREYVLVVAQEKEALTEAARLLCDKSRVKQLRDAAAYVSVGEAQRFLDAAQLSPLALEGQYTIKDIAGHGISFSGPFHQEVTIYLPVADDYTLSSESRFTFTIRYSENLDFDRSLMTVYWGTDVPLYSRQLRRDAATGETVSFAVPSDAVGMAGTALTIAFDLEVEDLDCTPRQMNMPWAYIAEDSVMYLPHGGSSAFSLGSLPAPFQHNSRMDNVMVVLAEKPLKEELMLTGRAMAMLGAGSTPYGSIRVARDNEFDANQADANLVVMGYSANNRMLKRLNPHLLFQYSDDMRRVLSNDKLILDESYAQTVGTIQMIASPYAPERALLALSAPSAEGLAAVTDAISTERARWALEKEAVLVNPHGSAESYQFTVSGQTLQTQQKPTFVQTVMENKEPMLLLLTGMGCMALALLGVVIVLVRIRVRKRKE